MLETHDITKDFGGLRALNRVSVAAYEGELLGIIGPNGAGKTTLYNVISGVYRASGGMVLLQGENVTGLKSHQLAERGLSRTFQR